MQKKLKRNKQRKDEVMTKGQKIALGLLIVATIAYIKIAFFTNVEPEIPSEGTSQEQTTPEEEAVQKAPKAYVNVFFIGQNENNEEVYRAVKREYNAKTDGSKLRFAIVNLLKGPNAKEKAKGVYSEIPAGTRLISLEETPDKVVINLSADFEQGGGTDGLYKRLYQLIKTSNKNASTSVYLYLNGKQVDVIGGEGIMINQPLNERSLDE